MWYGYDVVDGVVQIDFCYGNCCMYVYIVWKVQVGFVCWIFIDCVVGQGVQFKVFVVFCCGYCYVVDQVVFVV